MKKILMSLVVTVLAASFAFAHGNHQGMGAPDAAMMAQVHVETLVKEKKLVESWKEAKVSDGETKSKVVEGKDRWFVILTNSKEKDSTKAKLQIVMTPSGKLVSQQLMKLETSK